MKQFFLGTLVFALPSMVFAAGFAKQSIFLSTNTPTEGQTIRIHALVSNPATTTFNGTLVVKDEASEIGTVPVKLDPGSADDVSVPWKPRAGTHTIVADLKDGNGVIVEEGKQEFTIAAAAGTSAASPKISTSAFAQPDDIQSSAPIQESIDNVSPAAGKVISPLFKTIDSGRTAAANQLHNAIDWSKSHIATSSKSTTKSSTASSAWQIFATAALYILTVLLYVVSNIGVFYPILGILFLFVLWKLYGRYRRR